MKKSRRLYFLFLVAIPMMGGCKRNPVDRLINPVPSGAAAPSGIPFGIYDAEVKTLGGAGFIPNGSNQTIDFANEDSPRRSTHQIRYFWNGGDNLNPNTGLLDHSFAGFSLLVSPNFSTIGSTPARDLSGAGYTKLKLFIRGQLSTANSVRIEGPSPVPAPSGFVPARKELDASQLTNDWQAVEVVVPSADFSNIKVFMTISIQYAQPPRTTDPGEGGTIYADDIRYEKM